jgi:hypothetical protein
VILSESERQEGISAVEAVRGKEIPNLLSDFGWAFKIGKMSAISQHGKARSGDRLSDVACTFYGDMIIISMKDERGDE